MAIPSEQSVTSEEFKLMTERAGLGMSVAELEELKPVYDLYAPYIRLLHSIDLQAEDMGVAFHPDWT